MSILLLMDDDEVRPLAVPVGFGYTPPFNIYSDGTTSFRFDSLYDAIDPADITDYYVSPSGATGNNGLTPATPKLSIGAMLTTAAGAATPWVRINIAAGDYGWNGMRMPGISWPNKNVILKVTSGNAFCGPFYRGTGLPWALNSGTTYSTTRSAVYEVRDYTSTNSYGDPIRYTLAADLTACQATPNSWFQSGSTLYVNNGVGQPGANVLVLVTGDNSIWSQNKTAIIDGGASGSITFLGGQTSCFRAIGTNDQTVYARRAYFRFSKADDCYETIGTGLSLAYQCKVSGSYLDGFNYHSNGAALPTAIEIECEGYDCGSSGTGTNNASTIHDGGAIVRVSGSYQGTDGPVIADVNDGTRSWNVTCLAKDSLRNNGAETDASWGVYTGSAKMWLDRCTYGAGASTSEYDLAVGAGSTMYLRGTPEGNSSVAGTLATY